jgi:MSHA pilin protein MshC
MGSRAMPGRQSAFSLVELVAVLIIIGILAAFALPRFADVDRFAERGFFEEALAATRYAQKLAVASGCSIRVEFSAAANTFDVSRWTGSPDCTIRAGSPVTVARPGSTTPFQASAPPEVNVGNNLTFFFDRVGRPRNDDVTGALITNPANLRVSIGPREIQVTPDTGLVVGN